MHITNVQVALMPKNYDEVPYIRLTYAESHPDRLATIATLFGLVPPEVATCRVLELGCASGDNLCAMAVAMPDASFTGVDYSPLQIEQATQLARQLKLENVSFRCLDMAEISDSWGKFDYIIAHGLYSWVEKPLQDKLLSICRGNLQPNGVAYVSYNVLPGWQMRGIVRDIMRLHTSQSPDGLTGARQLVDLLAKHSKPDSAYGVLLRAEAKHIREQPDAYLLHDYLEETNDAVYFQEFAASAQEHQLQYLGDAEFRSMLPADVPTPIAEVLNRTTRDLLVMEQYLDFFRNRIFRRSLLVHGEVEVNRILGSRSVERLTVTSLARTLSLKGKVQTYGTPEGGTISTDNALLKAAMRELIPRGETGLPFAQLLTAVKAAVSETTSDSAERLATNLIEGYAQGAFGLHAWSPPMAFGAADPPLASPWARHQAESGESVTNLRHTTVKLDPFQRELLKLLDGTRTRAVLSVQLSKDSRVPARQVSDQVDAALQRLGQFGLMLG
jgi:methyltransferase-like protein/trans-aconitate methyltransferase